MPGEKCHLCGKSVYAAELRRYDGKIFHASCFAKFKKQQEADDSAKRNIEYGKTPDVSPAYYRVADPSTGQAARMLSGEQERAEFAREQRTEVAAKKNVSPSSVSHGSVCPCGALLPNGAKFCAECGAKVEAKRGCPHCGFADANGKFCSNCGGNL